MGVLRANAVIEDLHHLTTYFDCKLYGARTNMALGDRPAAYVFCAYVFCASLLGLLSPVAGQTLSLPLDTIALPPGFTIDLYTSTPLPSARTLVLSDNTTAGNIVFVSTNRLNNVSSSADC